MSKIICDVCGASYDDAAGACPLCGWRPGQQLDTDIDDFETDMLDDLLDDSAPAAAPKAALDLGAVSGRSAAAPAQARPVQLQKKPEPKAADDDDEDDDDDDEEEEKSGSNPVVIIILILLILALLGVAVYIGYRTFLNPENKGNQNNAPTEVTVQTEAADKNITFPTAPSVMDPGSAVETTGAVDMGIPCTDLTLVGTMDKLTFAGQYWRLMAKAAPENTTDKITYLSGDESVVTIDENGRVTAVGEGTTTITVICGDKRLETTAVVDFGGAAAAAGTAAPAVPGGTAGAVSAGTAAVPETVPTGSGSLKIMYHGSPRTDFTLSRRGVYITLELANGISAQDVKWVTTDASVANVNNGNVTAIGRGTCRIIATYNGETAEATVRCKW